MVESPARGALVPEPGSFRDPAGRVFHGNGAVYRTLDQRGRADWEALAASRFFARATADGRIVATTAVGGDEAAALMPPGDWAGLLRHEPLPLISYPYEWTFSMLRAAALLQLDLLAEALSEDLILKDATPFNFGFRGSRPVFMDIGSFQRLEPGDPWVGYRQFSRQFLYPLMLRAHKGVPFQHWLRGDPEGPTAGELRALLSGGDLWRRGVLMHVSLPARAERRFQDDRGSLRDDLQRAGFSKQMIEANVSGLRKLVGKLNWEPATSEWSGYAAECGHVAAHRDVKAQFLRRSLQAVSPTRVLDLGANDGFFSRIAAEHAAYVVAADADELVLDNLYRRLASEGVSNVQPLLVDLANPSPGIGWRGRERQPLGDRFRPDLVVCYALIHHLVVGRNVPLAHVVDWLADYDCPAVLEFVAPEDPLALRLSANKRPGEIHADYHESALRELLEARFVIEAEERLAGGTRLLLSLHPRR